MAFRADSGKHRMELLSSTAMVEWAKVMTFGATKYSDDNWRKGMKWRRVIGSLSRHLAAYNAGQTLDPETGLSHMAHVMANASMLLEYEKTLQTFDDRYIPRGLELPCECFSPLYPFVYTYDKDYYELSKSFFEQNFPHLPYYLCADHNEFEYWCGKHNCNAI